MLVELGPGWYRAEDVRLVYLDREGFVSVNVEGGGFVKVGRGPEVTVEEVADRVNLALGGPERFASVDEDGRVVLYTVTPRNADRKVWAFEEPWPRPLDRGGAGADDERVEAAASPGARPFRVDVRNDWGPLTEPPGSF